jgi:hypothetical protein
MNQKTNQSATMATTVTAMRASSITTSAMTASTTAAVAATSTLTDQKSICKSNRIKNATSVSQ